MADEAPYVAALSDLDASATATVGGKNASLGEMIRHLHAAGIRVPGGFATTAQAYRDFLAANGLAEKIRRQLDQFHAGDIPLERAGRAIRRLFTQSSFPPRLAREIREGYTGLQRERGGRLPAVAVRSSATAEDLPEASFAGQQESFLNVRGEEELLDACRRCFASLFTDRAIAYREEKRFDHMAVALSVGVQRMVRSDTGGAGVMFSIDTETGFPDAVLINAAWGLGETVVQGAVDPDEYRVFKPLLERRGVAPIIQRRRGGKAKKMVYGAEAGKPTRTVNTDEAERAGFVLGNDEVLTLARWAVAIERHYDRPMDIEWAKDGETGELHVVQARPETVQSRRTAGSLKRYTIRARGETLARGLSIGDAVAAGKALRLSSPDQIDRFEDGAVLVTGMTDPDWVPIMKRAAAIVTDHGGRTSHAAIVSRELGLPAVVGTGNASSAVPEGEEVTVSCAEGDEGFVYRGVAEFSSEDIDLSRIPQTRTRIMVNLANPAAALRWWQLPSDGVGLARMEFIINNVIKIHPLALSRFDEVDDRETRRRIEELTRGFGDKREYFVENLALGIAMIAASHYPKKVIVRLSDFKTNEYANLIGGRMFEPEEENPMLGWRGASRYYSEDYRDGFAMECDALRRVREAIGLDNVALMIPFCRTTGEADRVLEVLAANGLVRGEGGLQVYVMCEVPSNVIRAKAFAGRFDGFSIGSNDLTQLVLGVDRDSERLSELFDEEDEAVTSMIGYVIRKAHEAGREVGLCGQAPSDRPSFARLLVKAGIDSISVSPDSFLQVKQHVADAESGGVRSVQAGSSG